VESSDTASSETFALPESESKQARLEITDLDDGTELTLEPEKSRATAFTSTSLEVFGEQASSFGGGQRKRIDPAGDQPLASTPRPRERAASVPLGSAYRAGGLADAGDSLPSHRSYPTLEAIQRLYKIFGYVAVAIVFPYLFIQLVRIILGSAGDTMQRLIEFSQFAVPVLFGTVVFSGTVFALAEGIQLAIDIQANTLATARRSKRG
jgi:hypothetical protein